LKTFFYNSKVSNLIIRFIAGVLPLLLAFLLPKIIGINVSSIFFSVFSRMVLISAFMRLGQDMVLLKSKPEVDDLDNIFFVQNINFVLILIICVFFNFEIMPIIMSFAYSINIIFSSYYLSIEQRNRSLLIQFFYPSICILTFFYFVENYENSTYWVLIISYGLPVFFVFFKSLYRISSKIKNINYVVKLTNLSILTYTILSIAINTIPTLIAKRYFSSGAVVSVFQAIKFISISSFMSSLLLFSFNSELRVLNKKVLFRYFYRYSYLMLLLFAFVVYFFNYFNIFTINTYVQFAMPFIMLLILLSNIIGHYFILHSLEKYNLFSIAISSLFIFSYYFLFTAFKKVDFYMQFFYIFLISIEAILKLFFFLKLNNKTDRSAR
jgi:hypothetical protein